MLHPGSLLAKFPVQGRSFEAFFDRMRAARDTLRQRRSSFLSTSHVF